MLHPEKELIQFFVTKVTPNRIFRPRQELRVIGIDDDWLKALKDKEILDMLSGLRALYDLDER